MRHWYTYAPNPFYYKTRVIFHVKSKFIKEQSGCLKFKYAQSTLNHSKTKKEVKHLHFYNNLLKI